MGGHGYSASPWEFRGRALYQLNLVKADDVRRNIPSDFRLVEFCGWTLGGLYLARYDDSPAGAFDELVVLAGLVWNPPTSCAWAHRVYVNAKAARDHGIRVVGLPSRLATFQRRSSARLNAASQGETGDTSWWTERTTPAKDEKDAQGSVVIANSERGPKGMAAPVARLALPRLPQGWGPRIRMSLPSFSGGTAEHPGLLQYTCQLHATVNFVEPVRTLGPASGDRREGVDTILQGKPLLCMSFRDMMMTVPKPVPYVAASDRSSNDIQGDTIWGTSVPTQGALV